MNGESVEPKALFTKDTLDNQAASKPAQMTGAIHVACRTAASCISATARAAQRWLTASRCGRAARTRSACTRSIRKPESRRGYRTSTAAACTRGRSRSMRFQQLLVAANQNAVTKPDGTRVPASLAVFRIGDDGKLSFLRKYDIETGRGTKPDVGGVLETSIVKSKVESSRRVNGRESHDARVAQPLVLLLAVTMPRHGSGSIAADSGRETDARAAEGG